MPSTLDVGQRLDLAERDPANHEFASEMFVPRSDVDAIFRELIESGRFTFEGKTHVLMDPDDVPFD